MKPKVGIGMIQGRKKVENKTCSNINSEKQRKVIKEQRRMRSIMLATKDKI